MKRIFAEEPADTRIPRRSTKLALLGSPFSTSLEVNNNRRSTRGQLAGRAIEGQGVDLYGMKQKISKAARFKGRSHEEQEFARGKN